MAPSAPVAAALSNKLVVDNDQMRDDTIDVDYGQTRTRRNGTGKRLSIATIFHLMDML